MLGIVLRWFTGNPVLMIWVALAILAVGLGTGFWTGWTINGWRIGFQLEQERRESQRWRDQAAAVAASVKACNAGVDAGKAAASAAMQAAEAARKAAGVANAPLRDQLARIESKINERPTSEQSADCNWGWESIEAQPRPKAGAP